MGKNSIEPGWQRFLVRLKQLWGKLRGGDVPQTVNTARGHDCI
jgi:hypothetical protein